MESEYIALSDTTCEAITQKQFFQELQIPSAIRHVPLLTDSQTALDISDNPAKYRQAKHIDVRYHAVRSLHSRQQDSNRLHSISTSAYGSLH